MAFNTGLALSQAGLGAIDTVVPMRGEETEGSGKDRKDCMQQFRAAWDRFSSDPGRLTEFLKMKRVR